MNYLERLPYYLSNMPHRFTMACMCLLFSLMALVLMAQCFIPPLRRLYVRLIAWGLSRLGLRQRVQEYAALLGAYGAWLVFSAGLCLLPFCFGLFLDAQSTYDGALAGMFSYGLVFGFFSVPLLALAFLICSLVTFIRWRQLRRSPNA